MILGTIVFMLFIIALVCCGVCIYILLSFEFSHNDCLRKKEILSIGTKSILFGAHCFLIHPVIIAIAWIKLYGFPFDPRIWISFFVHDLGYLGKADIDGSEGRAHVILGANIMSIFDKKGSTKWHDFAKYHSRYYAKEDNAKPSKLCIADKLAICIEPSWLYLPRVKASGEILEFMAMAKSGGLQAGDHKDIYYAWHKSVKAYMRKWVEEHKDGKDDLWTPKAKESLNELGVLQ